MPHDNGTQAKARNQGRRYKRLFCRAIERRESGPAASPVPASSGDVTKIRGAHPVDPKLARRVNGHFVERQCDENEVGCKCTAKGKQGTAG